MNHGVVVVGLVCEPWSGGRQTYECAVTMSVGLFLVDIVEFDL